LEGKNLPKIGREVQMFDLRIIRTPTSINNLKMTSGELKMHLYRFSLFGVYNFISLYAALSTKKKLPTT
jgi:hypothetical protein